MPLGYASGYQASQDVSWEHSMFFMVALAGVAALVFFFVYGKSSSKSEGGKTAGTNDSGFLGYRGSVLTGVDNKPGTRYASVERLPPLFASSSKDGYRCLRCSDEGASDFDKVYADELPAVRYQCPSGEAIAWNRSVQLLRAQRAQGQATGNLITQAPATPQPGDPQEVQALSGLALCDAQCKLLPSKFGKCAAAVYNKTNNKCEFYFNCDRVEPDQTAAMALQDFSMDAQPDVISTGY